MERLINFPSVLELLKQYFDSHRIKWMVVSGTAVYLYSHRQRELTDLDIVVKSPNLFDVEALLRKLNEVDGLSAVRFVGKFGQVSPLTPYLRMFIRGVEVHISTDWLYRTDAGRVIHIPYHESTFDSASTIDFDKVKVKVAQPEFIFLCKSITNRIFKDGRREIKKDENDCELILKSVTSFNFDLLHKLYTEIGYEEAYREFALPLKNR